MLPSLAWIGRSAPQMALCLALALPAGWLAVAGAGQAMAVELPGSLRDAFPVFDDPAVLSAREAEARGMVGPRDPVIGVVAGGQARAYPIAILGVHELGNDTLGGVPIAVTW